jgi:DNA-binding CsgD family transcriptional regulator
MDGLLERDRELAALDRLLGDAQEGRGALTLIEGPAGIGKSRLLAELRERAAGAMTVLTARCSELERDFSFGAVRQLLEPVARDREQQLAPAHGVLEAPGGAVEGSFAALHGLYWAVLNLAEERPVLLALDDLQWSDRPSLRFVAYLVRRLEGVPVLVAATLRTTEAGTDPALIAELAGDPLCEAVRPGPLGEHAVTELVRERLGEDADPRFCAACREATGGNPLLLRHLLGALEQDGVAPTASAAAVVRESGSRAVSRTVLLRLSRLREDAVAVARAVAVLGDSSALPAVAALSGLGEGAVARAAGELARADILRPETPLGFVHPLVRDVVYLDIPAGERELAHGRAAAVLAAAQAPAEEVAAQVLHAPRRGDPETVELLRTAAGEAAQRGGPDSAIAYLARALEEPPPPALRGALHFELGVAAADMSAPLTAEHLRRAYDELTEPVARATAAFALAQALLFTGGAVEGGELARRAAAELPPELADQRQALEAVGLMAMYFGAYDADEFRRLERYRHERDGDGPGAKMIAAAAAFAWAAAGGPAADCEALALESLAGGELLASANGLFLSAALVALIVAESPRTPEFLAAARAEARRTGTIFTTASVEMWSGVYMLDTGDLQAAGQALTLARQLQDPWGSDATGTSWARGLLGAHSVLIGDPVGARAALGEPPADSDSSDGANLWRRAHGALLLADGRAEEALAVAELMGRMAPHVIHPGWKPWQSLKGHALVLLGRREEGIAAIRAELELARACDAPRMIGRSLRELGELEGEAGIDRLREAVDVLSPTPARLDLGRALASLGGALRRARRPAEAREPLRAALELAEACGCPPLVEKARSELYATGARPRTGALAGVRALTASEHRVATLAAGGQTNREIAQALFVTPKTVEVHLSNAYRKLGIRSRRELPGALG